MKRFQVDIKPNHQPSVRQLMKKLGNVSSADAIGFLIETQMPAALSRLEPALKMPQPATERELSVTASITPQQHHSQDVARSHKTSAASHTTTQDDATNALEALLSA